MGCTPKSANTVLETTVFLARELVSTTVRLLSSQTMSSSQSFKGAPNAGLQQQQRSMTTGFRYPSNRKTIYDRNLGRSKNAELSRAAFAYLFVEMISYAQRKVTGIADLEKKYFVALESLVKRRPY